MANSYSKLRSGEWGVRVEGPRPDEGTTFTIKKKDGTENAETIIKIVWSAPDGRTHLCAIQAKPRASARGDGGGNARRCRTGGNCSSFGDGRSCGAPDCDGY